MNPTITFGIPIAPKGRIDYWPEAMINLNRTLRSLENQTSSSYNVVLVKTGDDELELDKEYRNLFILKCPTLNEFSEDKDDKTKLAIYFHWELKGIYFFRLDWDDLISKRLVKYLENTPNKDMWIIQYGYFYRPDINSIIPFKDYWKHCGSSLAVDYTEDECKYGPDHEFHHQRIHFHRMKLGKSLGSIPFFAGIYTVHGKNISTEKHRRIFKDAKWYPITNKIKEEFGL